MALDNPQTKLDCYVTVYVYETLIYRILGERAEPESVAGCSSPTSERLTVDCGKANLACWKSSLPST